MLGRTCKMSFWIVYDHLGKFLLLGLLWSMGLLLPGWLAVVSLFSGERSTVLFVAIPSAIFTVGIALPVMSTGLAHLVKTIIDKRDGSLRDFFDGVRQYAVRAIATGLIVSTILVGLATSSFFYAAHLKESVPWLGYLLSGVAVWGFVFVIVLALYIPSAIVQKKAGVRETLKLAAILEDGIHGIPQCQYSGSARNVKTRGYTDIGESHVFHPPLLDNFDIHLALAVYSPNILFSSWPDCDNVDGKRL